METVNNVCGLKFDIVHQERYSRAELLLRSFFGFIYIMIPHVFLLFFVAIASSVLSFIAWWAILFTATYPRSLFDFQVGMLRWSTRLTARLFNLSDGYPAFGLSATDNNIVFDVEHPGTQSRALLLVRLLFGHLYVGIPHGIILLFRFLAMYVVLFIAWWAVLITGKFPKGMHNFVTDTIRWANRVSLYLSFMTDRYPPFTGK